MNEDGVVYLNEYATTRDDATMLFFQEVQKNNLYDWIEKIISDNLIHLTYPMGQGTWQQRAGLCEMKHCINVN